MDKKIKLIIIIALTVILAGTIFITTQIYSAKKALEHERNGLRSENTVLSRKIEEISEERKQLLGRVNALNNDLVNSSQEKESISKQYESIVKDRDSLLKEIKGLQDNNDKLRAELNTLSGEKERLGKDIESSLAPLREENKKLTEELDELKGVKSKLESELWQLIGEKSAFEEKLSQVDLFLRQRLSSTEYSTLKEQIEGIISSVSPGEQGVSAETAEESVELPPIVVKPKAEAETPLGWLAKRRTPPRPTATVLEVNRDSGFVIIDMGQDAGVKIGDSLNVYRQGAPIAAVHVIQVRQSISACDIKEENTLIEKGDIVR